jgi:lysyl-tRNA synthetase class 2
MTPPDYLPTAPWQMLHARAELLRKLREFFHALGFLEVETPLLSADVVIDRHLDPLQVTLYENPQQPTVGQTYYLQTSPEFAMKRLLAGGAEAIYQVTHAFRAGERGAYHNPEFTMVEWYRAGDSMQSGMQLLSDLAEMLFVRGAAVRVSYREAFRQQLGCDPHTAGTNRLADIAHQNQLAVPNSFTADDRDAYLELIMSELIQPHLGRQQPAIIYDYPASQSALAIVRPDDPPVAERFELFVDGVELANGYHELLDASELERRNQHNNQARMADGKQPLPAESHLLAAMRHGLPACSGTALGFDRAVMVALGAKSIDEVIPFPIERA